MAHLYVIYWGLASFITPPSCTPVFIASSIGGSNIWETGWEAVRLGIGTFVVPFAFVYNRALLMEGSPAQILAATVTALAGAGLLAASVRGFAFHPLTWLQRVLLFASALFLIGPTTLLTVAIGVLLALLWNYQSQTREVKMEVR